LRSTNKQIAKLAADKPARDIHSAFTVVAQLATEGVDVATQMEKVPGIEAGQMQSVLSQGDYLETLRTKGLSRKRNQLDRAVWRFKYAPGA